SLFPTRRSSDLRAFNACLDYCNFPGAFPQAVSDNAPLALNPVNTTGQHANSLLVRRAMTAELQHSVTKSAGFSGTSLHTGEKVALKLQPAPVDHGIKFKRKDLADEPTID